MRPLRGVILAGSMSDFSTISPTAAVTTAEDAFEPGEVAGMRSAGWILLMTAGLGVIGWIVKPTALL
jgi:hypothetical protein